MKYNHPFAIKLLGITFFIIALYLVGYYLVGAIEEGKRYKKPSLDYLLFTPQIIKNQPITDATTMKFYFDAGDGPKPFIFINTFETFQESAQTLEQLQKYLIDKGFKKERSDFVKGNVRMEIDYDVIAQPQKGRYPKGLVTLAYFES